MQRDKSFMGMRTRRVRAIYLTEERPTTFRQVLARTELQECEDIIILSKHDVPRDMSWPDLLWQVALYAKVEEADLIVIDTLAEWASLAKDSENDSGSALWAMRPLQTAAARGLAILVSRHDSKVGGDVGVAGRGSSAFTGAVDISLLLKRTGGDTPTRRELQAIGRFDDTPSKLIIELRDGVYMPLGSTADAAKSDARRQLLDVLPVSEDDAIEEDALIEALKATGLSKGTIGKALRELLDEGLVSRIGKGKKGSPYKYSLPRNSFSQSIYKGWENEYANGKARSHLVEAAIQMGARIVSVHEESEP